VARFFPSVYTHTIPWALNGRSQAKADGNHRSTAVYGNRLDFIFRQAQDRQTIGIPIGPDASRIVGELVLSAVDGMFLSLSGRRRPTYLRHVDDYWIGGHSVDECERHLQTLRTALREYELDVNELKTRILPTNQIIGESWPTELQRELRQNLDSHRSSGRNDTITTLSNIIDRATRNNDEGMIRHVIRKIDEYSLWDRHWDLLEHFLAQCSIQFPHAFDYVARVVSWRIRTSQAHDRNLWSDVASVVATQASELGRDSEVLWALWLIKELGVRITRKMTTNIVRGNGPIVLAYVAHAYANGLIREKRFHETLWARVAGNRHAGQFWPLTLELDYLEIPETTTQVEGDGAARVLHESGASLIDWNAAPKVFLEEDQWSGRPMKAIEDYTSDYESDEGEEENDLDSFSPLRTRVTPPDPDDVDF
jgi:hypothetical protein